MDYSGERDSKQDFAYRKESACSISFVGARWQQRVRNIYFREAAGWTT